MIIKETNKVNPMLLLYHRIHTHCCNKDNLERSIIAHSTGKDKHAEAGEARSKCKRAYGKVAGLWQHPENAVRRLSTRENTQFRLKTNNLLATEESTNLLEGRQCEMQRSQFNRFTPHFC